MAFSFISLGQLLLALVYLRRILPNVMPGSAAVLPSYMLGSALVPESLSGSKLKEGTAHCKSEPQIAA